MEKEMIAHEIPEFISLVADITKQLPEINKSIVTLRNKVDKDDRNEGLSFLDMKIQLLLKYLINMTYTMVLKIDGLPLADHPSISRLVELRTVIEKCRPLEKKLQYQIDKLVKSATLTDEHAFAQHPLSFRPNIDDLVPIIPDKQKFSTNDENGETSSGVYVPLKRTAVHYDEDDNTSKMSKKLQKAREKSINNMLFEDLQEDFGDAPLEIQDSKTFNKRAKMKKIEDERTKFEEDNMRRLTLTKKDKIMKRKLNELDEVVKLGNFRSINDSSDDDGEMNYKPKIKKKKGRHSSKKFKKRMQRKK